MSAIARERLRAQQAAVHVDYENLIEAEMLWRTVESARWRLELLAFATPRALQRQRLFLCAEGKTPLRGTHMLRSYHDLIHTAASVTKQRYRRHIYNTSMLFVVPESVLSTLLRLYVNYLLSDDEEGQPKVSS